jgi:hypothetical protein
MRTNYQYNQVLHRKSTQAVKELIKTEQLSIRAYSKPIEPMLV